MSGPRGEGTDSKLKSRHSPAAVNDRFAPGAGRNRDAHQEHPRGTPCSLLISNEHATSQLSSFTLHDWAGTASKVICFQCKSSIEPRAESLACILHQGVASVRLADRWRQGRNQGNSGLVDALRTRQWDCLSSRTDNAHICKRKKLDGLKGQPTSWPFGIMSSAFSHLRSL